MNIAIDDIERTISMPLRRDGVPCSVFVVKWAPFQFGYEVKIIMYIEYCLNM